MNEKCRICGGALGYNAFVLKNMPAQAQYFPTAQTVQNDAPVDLILKQCGNCGVIQLESGLVPYWREVVRAAAYSPEMKAFRLKQFSNWLEKYGLKGKRVLEAGCGRGEYLSLMRQCGAVACGTEYGAENAEAARRAGLDVERVVFETGNEVLNQKADGFFVLNWLEHLPDIRAFLTALRRNTTQNAVGLIEVPNAELIFKHGQVFEITQDHLYYFTQESFRRVLQMNGFDVLSLQPVWNDYILSAVVKKRTSADFAALSDGLERLSDSLRRFAEPFEKIAVWGAGHQALTALCISGVAEKVSFVIDSAPFKQGKLTPVTHLPIVPPDFLKTHSVAAILVACAAYNDEIVAFLKENYAERMAIGILTAADVETVFENCPRR